MTAEPIAGHESDPDPERQTARLTSTPQRTSRTSGWWNERARMSTPPYGSTSWTRSRRRTRSRGIHHGPQVDVLPGLMSRDSGLGRLTLLGASCFNALCGHVCPSYRHSTGV